MAEAHLNVVWHPYSDPAVLRTAPYKSTCCYYYYYY